MIKHVKPQIPQTTPNLHTYSTFNTDLSACFGAFLIIYSNRPYVYEDGQSNRRLATFKKISKIKENHF